MHKRESLSHIYSKNFMILMFVFFVFVFALWTYFDIITQYKETSKVISEQIIKEKKLLLKGVTDNVINYINYNYNLTEKNLKQTIKEETFQALSILNSLYEKYYNKLPEKESISLIRDTLRSIRYKNNIGYFFAFDLNGIEQVFADRPELEGKNIINIKDAKGHFVLKDMLKIIKEKGEGFYTYYWSKPDVKNKKLIYKKIAYIKLFKPLNWVVGTGMYYNDMEKEVKKRVKQYIKNYCFDEGEKGRIFIVKPNIKNNKIVGVKYLIPEKPDAYLNKIIPESLRDKNKLSDNFLHKCFSSSNGEFIECHPNINHPTKFPPKLTYAKYYPKWQWVIVAGTNLKLIDLIIKKQQQRLLKHFITEFIIIMFFMVFLFLVLVKIFSRINKKSKEEFLNIISKFKNNFMFEKIDNSKIAIEELYEISEIMNSLIENIRENNEILSAYFNKPNIANFIIHANGYFGRVNKTFEEITGYSASEIKSLKFDSFLHPEFKDEATERVLKRLKGESIPQYYECKIITKSGDIKWVLLLNTHIYLKSKGEDIILGTGLDITEHKKLIAKLDEQYNLFKTLIDSLSIPVWVFDVTTNTFKIVNKSFYEYFEIEDSVIGKKPDEIFAKNIYETAYKTNKEVIESKKTKICENIIKLKNGERTILITKSPLFDNHGNVTGIVGISIDITDKLNLEKEIAKNRNLESIGFLAGGIAHDFNNILTGILGSISLLEFYIKDEKVKDILSLLGTAVKRAEKLSNKLLTFSKGSYLVKKSSNIYDIIKTTTDFVFTGTSVKVNYDFDKDIPEILLDKDQISEVLHNILLNARQSMEKNNGKFVNIELKVVFLKENEIVDLKEGNYVKIGIKDSGEGISKDIIYKIFDPYFTTKETGSGLGLALSYSIVKQHGGTIKAYSKESEGALFEIYLPCIETNNKSNRKNKPNANNVEKTQEKKLNILILEDEEDIRDLLKEIFHILGHNVDFAVTGEEALKLYNEKYNMVILDMTIKGGMGGLEIMEFLKEKNPDVYAIVTTGYADSDVVKNYAEYGFKDMLLKPYNIEKLNRIFENYWNQH